MERAQQSHLDVVYHRRPIVVEQDCRAHDSASGRSLVFHRICQDRDEDASLRCQDLAPADDGVDPGAPRFFCNTFLFMFIESGT